MMNTSLIIFDFNKESDISNWVVVDDVVMGGRSNGDFNLNSDGHGVFEGVISLENNGGFSSLRYQLDKVTASKYSKISLLIKGDGKKFQFRLKSDSSNKYAYTTTFQTKKEWQTIEIPFSSLKPTFRGRKMNFPNFNGDSIGEIGFLYGNKQNESFKLLIATIVII